MTVLRQRMTTPPPDNPASLRAHSGRERMVVLSGTAGGPGEILGIFDREARRGHNAGKKA